MSVVVTEGVEVPNVDKRTVEEQQREANNALKSFDSKINEQSPYLNEFMNGVQEYKKSMETPEQMQQRQKDQRNAAMWTAVTDGINNIFNLTHASTNANARPQQLASTSEAVRTAAENADARYEKQMERLMQLNQQAVGMDLQQRAARMGNLKDSYGMHTGIAKDTQDNNRYLINRADAKAQNAQQAAHNEKVLEETIRHNKAGEANSSASLSFQKQSHNDAVQQHKDDQEAAAAAEAAKRKHESEEKEKDRAAAIEKAKINAQKGKKGRKTDASAESKPDADVKIGEDGRVETNW